MAKPMFSTMMRSLSASVATDAIDKNKRTAMWLDPGNLPAMAALIYQGADLQIADQDGVTPFLNALELHNPET
jgi:hypothetical protein